MSNCDNAGLHFPSNSCKDIILTKLTEDTDYFVDTDSGSIRVNVIPGDNKKIIVNLKYGEREGEISNITYTTLCSLDDIIENNIQAKPQLIYALDGDGGLYFANAYIKTSEYTDIFWNYNPFNYENVVLEIYVMEVL